MNKTTSCLRAHYWRKLAMTFDEYGGIEGIVTMEDIIETKVNGVTKDSLNCYY